MRDDSVEGLKEDIRVFVTLDERECVGRGKECLEFHLEERMSVWLDEVGNIFPEVNP